MITLIPAFDKIEPQVIETLKSVFPETKIFVSTGGEIISGYDKIIKHINNAELPLERIMHYYNNILSGFVSLLSDCDENEEVLLIHDNVIVNENVKLLLNTNELSDNIFINSRDRKSGLMVDVSDRCISFTVRNFILCHSFSNTKDKFKGNTTIQFIMKELDKLGLKYLQKNEVTVKELNSFWNG